MSLFSSEIVSSVESVRLFLSSGNSVNEVNKKTKENALFGPAKNNPQVIQFLIEQGIKVNKNNNYNRNALFYSTNLETVKLLVNAGINLFQLDNNQNNVLLLMVDKIDILEYLLETDLKNYITLENQTGISLLDLALDNLFLLKNLDRKIDLHQYTEKILFNNKISENVLQYLITEKEININFINDKGRNALFYTNFNIMKILIEIGLDFKILDKNDENLFFVVKNEETFSFLINLGLKDDINQINRNGENALFKILDYPILIKLFLDNNIDPTVINSKGENIITAASNVYYKISKQRVKNLVENDISVNLLNGNGKNSLFLIKNLNILTYLIKQGIDFSSLEIPINNYTREYDKFFTTLLNNGFWINNFKWPKDVKNTAEHFKPFLTQYNLNSSYFINFLTANDHLDFPYRLRDEKISSRMLSQLVRQSPELISVSEVLEQGNTHLLSILYYGGIYPKVKIFEFSEFHNIIIILDELYKVQIIGKLISLGNNFTSPDIISLNRLELLNNEDHEKLNKLMAPLFIKELYYHPVTQATLQDKSKSEKDDLYKYYYENAKKLFDYLSEEEILNLLGTTRQELKRLRLRKSNYFNSETVNSKTVFPVSDNLWDLLFENT